VRYDDDDDGQYSEAEGGGGGNGGGKISAQDQWSKVAGGSRAAGAFSGTGRTYSDDLSDHGGGRGSATPRGRAAQGSPAPKRKAGGAKGEAITVGVRIRPLVAEAWESHLDGGLTESFYAELDRTVLELDDAAQVCNSWTFDFAWGASVSTAQVFDDLCLPVVDKAMDGVNGTVFAYGQTAAGKTFSMFGTDENPGITTRAVHAVFDKVQMVHISNVMFQVSGFALVVPEEHLACGARSPASIARDHKSRPFPPPC
jgi:hypothetical protein